jgi:hypothetical protein
MLLTSLILVRQSSQAESGMGIVIIDFARMAGTICVACMVDSEDLNPATAPVLCQAAWMLQPHPVCSAWTFLAGFVVLPALSILADMAASSVGRSHALGNRCGPTVLRQCLVDGTAHAMALASHDASKMCQLLRLVG